MPALTIKRLREVLDYDETTGVFRWKVALSRRAPVGSVAGTIAANGYRYIRIDKENHLAHRLAWFYVHGKWPVDKIDHRKSGRPHRSENRIGNLREATTAQNARNAGLRATNSSGIKGVSWDASKQKWFAKITVDYRQISLGRYDSKEEAAAAYAHVAAMLHGDYAKLPETSAALSSRALYQTKMAVQRVRMKLIEEDRALRESFWKDAAIIGGMTEEQYYVALERQDHRCPVCKKRGDEIHNQTPMALAPDLNEDGAVTGLLCAPCRELVGAVRHYKKYKPQFDAYFAKHGMHEHAAAAAAMSEEIERPSNVAPFRPKEIA